MTEKGEMRKRRQKERRGVSKEEVGSIPESCKRDSGDGAGFDSF
jgi:hypothetical protein